MDRYRIIEKGEFFIIAKKFLIFWITLRYPGGQEMTFVSLEDARNKCRQMLAEKRASSKKNRVIEEWWSR